MMLFIFIFLLATPNSHGVEFVVRSTCHIKVEKNTFQVFDASSQTPLFTFPVEARCLHTTVVLRTDTMGQHPNPEGMCFLLHPGSEFYDPCFAWTYVPRNQSNPNMPSFWVWLFVIAAGVLVFLSGRRFSRPQPQTSRSVMPDENPPEPLEIEISPEKRTFLPWRKPALQGQVVVWESSLPLPRVRITFTVQGVQNEIVSDENGMFVVPANAVHLVCEKEGFHTVTVSQPTGRLVVRMMSLPVRALWLLRHICQRHDPKRAAQLSPRDALAACIPPPDVIARLEILAYGGLSPEPGELDKLAKELHL